MKVFFSSYKNPYFITITEYIEKALKEKGCQTVFFNNRDFIIPGRLRQKVSFLEKAELRRINRRLIERITSLKLDLFLEVGGYRIMPETVDMIKKADIRTALWTIDAPRDFSSIIKAAPHYDFVFTGGSEAYDLLKNNGVENLHFLPFACDPDFHKPQNLTDEEKKLYNCDIAFVGTIDPDLYPFRVKVLESISDFNLGVWGPGSKRISVLSPLKKQIRGDQTSLDVWTKIYSQAKIVLCIHYKDPAGMIPCHQASPRVYEALACGSFLMVDDQKDVKKLFKNREELVVFKDAHELRNLILYYLQRPEDRKSMAALGRKKVVKRDTYNHRVKELLKVVSK